MRETLRNVDSESEQTSLSIGQNYRSNVIVTLKWFCSEFAFENIERSLADLFMTAPRSRLLECTVFASDSSSGQESPSEKEYDSYVESTAVPDSVAGFRDFPFSLLQLKFDGISEDGVPWGAKVHLAVKSSSDQIWKTVLHDIISTSLRSEDEISPLLNASPAIHSDDWNPEGEVGMGTIAREFVHEVKNPLSAIMTSVGLIAIESSGRQATENREMLEIIEANAERMDLMLTEFARANRHPEIARSTQDLTGMISEISEEIQNEATSISVRLSQDAQSVLADVDPMLMGQAFRIATSGIPRILKNCREVIVSCTKSDDTAFLKFEYDGIGTGPDALRKVVLPFNSTKDGGSGLESLPIHTIVDAHGGKMSLRFTENETVLTIILPAHSQKKEILT